MESIEKLRSSEQIIIDKSTNLSRTQGSKEKKGKQPVCQANTSISGLNTHDFLFLRRKVLI
jgi:hypothetical protein